MVGKCRMESVVCEEFRSLLRDWHPDKNPEKKASLLLDVDFFLGLERKPKGISLHNSVLRTWPRLFSSSSRRGRACSTSSEVLPGPWDGYFHHERSTIVRC